jgi:hypothetical protein
METRRGLVRALANKYYNVSDDLSLWHLQRDIEKVNLENDTTISKWEVWNEQLLN